MATCADIDAALARLEAKIDAIPRIDENRIIRRAVQTVFISPEFTNLEGSVRRHEGQLSNHSGKIGVNEQKIAGLDSALGGVNVELRDLQQKVKPLQDGLADVRRRADTAQRTADTAGKRAATAQATADQVKSQIRPLQDGIADVRKRADNANLKAGRAIDRAQAVANELGNVKSRFESQINEVRETARRAATDAKTANAKATIAGERAREAIGKADNALSQARNAFGRADSAFQRAQQAFALAFPLVARVAVLVIQVAGLVGAVSGLFSLYAQLKIVFPRLDALDAADVRLGNDISRSLGLTALAIRKAENAQKDANHANQGVGQLNGEVRTIKNSVAKAQAAAETADGKAVKAQASAATADRRAVSAQRSADTANAEALEAQQSADAADNKAVKAQKSADNAGEVAALAQKSANVADSKATQATQKANVATSTANKAIDDAAYATGRADDAVDQSNRAVQKADAATNKANEAQRAADIAMLTSALARSTAIGADGKATQAQSEVRQVRPISERALSEAFVSLNTAGAANSTANISLGVTQVTATKLQATDLKVAQLEARPLTVTPLTVAPLLNSPLIVNPTQLNEKIISAPLNPKQKEEVKVIAAAAIKAQTPPENETLTQPQVKQVQDIIKKDAPKVNPATIKKIDEIHANSKTTTPLITIIHNTANSIKDTVFKILDGINAAIRGINNIGANITFVINQINVLVSKLNTFLTDVNEKLRAILNELIKGFAILVLLQPIILLMATRVAGIVITLGKLINWLIVDRIIGVFNLVTNLHNALMLSNSLKDTLLSMLASVGNATGLLQTAEGDSVDLNQAFNQGVEQFIVLVIGSDNYAGLRAAWKKYNRIYQAGANVISSVQNMFNSLGDAVETVAEHTGKIGNALRGAGIVAENAYQWFAEKTNAKISRFLQFTVKAGAAIAVFSAIEEIAETVIEGQESKAELDKNTAEFKKQYKEVAKNPGIENDAIKAEALEAKTRAATDPTGDDEVGLLSFLTDL